MIKLKSKQRGSYALVRACNLIENLNKLCKEYKKKKCKSPFAAPTENLADKAGITKIN